MGHTEWLAPDKFQEMKPTLVKLYLDAFWWWDDYLRSKATRRIGTSLKRVSARQKDTEWMNALQLFSDHWVSSWDEAELRADPRKCGVGPGGGQRAARHVRPEVRTDSGGHDAAANIHPAVQLLR